MSEPSEPSEWAKSKARELSGPSGLEQCWCDLTKSKDGCPTCRVEEAIARALDAALAPKEDAVAPVARHKCENGVVRALGADNDEIVEECPGCAKERT